MEYKNVFELVAGEFGKADIPFLLGGGMAVNYYHVARNTGDADFWIRESDFKRASEILEKFGYRKFDESNVFARFENDDLRLVTADLIFTDDKTFEGLQKAGKKVDVIDHQVLIPSLEHLLAMKIHAMKNNPERRFYKDVPDIANLILKNHIDVDSEFFHNLCIRYGSEKFYQDIRKAIKGEL